MKTKKLIGSLKRGFMQKIRLPRWSFWAKSHRGEREVVESTSGENRPRDQSRAKFLRNAAAGLTGTVAGAVVAGLAGSSVVEAACGDPALLCHSGNTGDPNLAANATEVQFNGAVNPGVVFLAQADNSFTPSDDVLFPAALAGWTSTNPNIPNGVYGFMQHPNGHGVVGWSLNKNGVYGRSSNASGSGVFGENPGGGNGVVGTASGVFPVAGVWATISATATVLEALPPVWGLGERLRDQIEPRSTSSL